MSTALPWLADDLPSEATRIREAIIARLKGQDWLPVRAIRRQPRPQIQEGDLPALFVVVVDENESPEDEANTGEPRFWSEVTIGISVVTGNDTPAALDEGLDDAIARIRRTLLTDPTFVRSADPAQPCDDPLFEAVTKIKRGRIFPQEGAGYRAEGRLELTFGYRTAYAPVVEDDFLHLTVNGRPAGAGADTPAIRAFINPAP